jgi:hypothetical protein
MPLLERSSVSSIGLCGSTPSRATARCLPTIASDWQHLVSQRNSAVWPRRTAACVSAQARKLLQAPVSPVISRLWWAATQPA